jgi:release factor glutamine methyltransferase
MLPTPSTAHLSFARIYEPAEDTFLLLDTLSSASESAFLRARFSPRRRPRNGPRRGGGRTSTPPPLILEVGAGSGAVLAFLAAHARAILGRADVAALATDVNEHACRGARDTVRLALAPAAARGGAGAGAALLASLAADLAAPLRPRSVDVLVFNPPYVPTDEDPASLLSRVASPSPPSPTFSSPVCYLPGVSTFERDSDLLALAYAGGRDGMETTARLLADLDSLLDPVRGVAYVLLCARNRPEEVVARIRAEWGPGWAVERVGHSGKKAGWEVLQVLRIWRTGADSQD